MTTGESHAARTRGWMLYAAAWVPLGLVYAALLAADEGVRFHERLGEGFVSTACAAILGVAVWWLTGRLAAMRSRALLLLVHGVGALVYSLAWLATIAIRIMLLDGVDAAGAFLGSSGTGWQVLSGAWLYGLLAGASHAVQAERAAANERRALVEVEALSVAAELRELRARLNPHFLFNSLHTLLNLVRRDPAMAEDALERLGDLLRYILNTSEREQFTPLSSELDFANDYIALERLRLGDRLRVDIQVDPETKDLLVPPLTLQPLIENAIRHGVAPRAGGGELRLRASRRDGRLCITVHDDGPGAPDSAKAGRGLGLAATRRRLELLFGDAARMTVTTAPGEGFTVLLDFPARVESADALSGTARGGAS